MAIITRREEFDPKREYVVAKPFKMSGVGMTPGAPFDKKSTVLRRVRQLYEMRLLAMVPANLAPTQSEVQAETPISLMSEDELRAWIKSRGAIARRKATRAQLLAQCEAILTTEAEAAATESTQEHADDEGGDEGTGATAEAA